MPRGNGIGPRNRGPMTGRAAGFCTGASMPGCANNGQGSGLGGCRRQLRCRSTAAGWVSGRRRSNGNVAPYQRRDQEMGSSHLRNRTEALQAELNYLRARLDQIEP